jgi:hypothetical protein
VKDQEDSWKKMKKVLLMFVILGMSTLPVFGDSLDLLAGYVVPRGGSDVFDQNELETTFETDDLGGFGGSIAYNRFLGEFVNLGFGVSFYESDTTVEDLDFEFSNGQPILRDIFMEIVPLEVSLHVLPTGRNAPVIPYVGGGFGVYFWKYEEIGDFIINRHNDPEIITGSAFSDGSEPGWHVEGGIMIPVSRSTTFTAEYKYWKADGDLDPRGFDPAFEPLDLSANMFSAGISIWF